MEIIIKKNSSNRKEVMRFSVINENGECVDNFAIDVKEETIVKHLNIYLCKVLNFNPYKYGGYKKFLEERGFELSFKKSFWKPENGRPFYYYCHKTGRVLRSFDSPENVEFKKLLKEYMLFPFGKMAYVCKDMSKIERLQILYQFENNMLFSPNWRSDTQEKYYLFRNAESLGIDYRINYKANNVHWKGVNELKEFIDIYRDELLELLK